MKVKIIMHGILGLFLIVPNILIGQLSYSFLDENFDSFRWFSKSVNVQTGRPVGIGNVCDSVCTKYLVFNQDVNGEHDLVSRELPLTSGIIDDVLVLGDIVWILSHVNNSNEYYLSNFSFIDSTFNEVIVDIAYRSDSFKGVLYPADNSAQLILCDRSEFKRCCIVSVDNNLEIDYMPKTLDQIEGALEHEILKLDSLFYLVEKRELHSLISYSLIQTPIMQSSPKIHFTPNFDVTALEPQLCANELASVVNTNFSYTFLRNNNFSFEYHITDSSIFTSGYSGLSPSSPVISDVQSFYLNHRDFVNTKMGYSLLIDTNASANFSGYFSVYEQNRQLSEQLLFFERLPSVDPCYEFGSIVKFDCIASNQSNRYDLYGTIDMVPGLVAPCAFRKIIPACFSLDSNFNLLPNGASVIKLSEQGVLTDTCAYILIEPVWSYADYSFTCETNISTVRWLRDTLVNNRLSSVIGKFNVDDEMVPNSELIVFYHNNSLEFFENGVWKVNYSLNAFPVFGDTINMSIPNNADLYDVSSNSDYSETQSNFRQLVDDVSNSGPSVEGLLPASSIKYSLAGIVDSIDKFPPRLDGFVIGVGSEFGFFGQPDLQAGGGCASELLCLTTTNGDFDIAFDGCDRVSSTESSFKTERSILYSSILSAGSIILAEDFFEFTILVHNNNGQAIPFYREGKNINFFGIPSGVYTISLSSKRQALNVSEQFIVIK